MPEPIRWRYKVIAVPWFVDPAAHPRTVTDLAEELNKWGDRGWEVLQMLADTRDGRTFLLKKAIYG